MNRKLSTTLTAAATAALLLGPASAALAGGNPPEVECEGLQFLTKFEGDALDFANGSVGDEADQDGVILTVASIDDPDNDGFGQVVDLAWTSETPIDRVVVKAGQHANVYDLDEATNGIVAAGVDHDVSHVTFCFDEDEPVDVPNDEHTPEPQPQPEPEPQPQPQPDPEPTDEPTPDDQVDGVVETGGETEVLDEVLEQPEELAQTGPASTLVKLLTGLSLLGLGGTLVRGSRRLTA